jgi:hypothetical protein
MKWMSLSLLAALALFANACERHSAEETKAYLEEEQAAKPSEAAPAAAVEPAAKPDAPAPAPAAPSDAKPAPGAAKQDGAPKFFDSK